MRHTHFTHAVPDHCSRLPPRDISLAGGKLPAAVAPILETLQVSQRFLRIRGGTALAPLGRRTMLRTATLLLVAILAGGPVGSLGCELWCASPAAANHHRSVGCHDASRLLPPGPQTASTVGCHDAAATTPFVTEARQAETTLVAVTPVALFDTRTIGLDVDETTAGWCVFNVQAARPPAFRTILRV